MPVRIFLTRNICCKQRQYPFIEETPIVGVLHAWMHPVLSHSPTRLPVSCGIYYQSRSALLLVRLSRLVIVRIQFLDAHSQIFRDLI
jgi:hypothetical protein